jgi:PAS domain S-box-containing protein
MAHPPWWGSAFEHLAANSRVRIAVVRWDGGDDAIVEWTNPASAAMLGVPADDVAGRRVSEVYPARYLPDVIEQFRQAREHGSYSYEVVRELPSGRRTLDAVSIAMEEALFLSVAIDVTGEREAQRRLEEVSRHTGTGLYHWNIAEDEVSWTDELFHLLGYEPGSVDATADRYLQHVHPEDRGELEQVTADARAGAGHVANSRHRIVRVGGDIRTVDVRAQAVTDESERLLYVLGVIRDVTDEVELQRHTELLHRAEQQQRTALTVHDKVVQALATVVLALDLDELATAREEAMEAVAAAQRVVADLLGEVADVQGPIGPGSLRVVPTADDGS